MEESDEKLELFQLGEEESPSRDFLCDCDIFVDLCFQLYIVETPRVWM